MDTQQRPDSPKPAAPASEDYAVRVLLVDDQAMIGEAVRRALANHSDIVFHYCDNPAEAIKVADRIRATVILQDLVMPGIDGLSLVQHYRANSATKDIPIIVLSTKEDPTVKSEAFARGASDYLVKLPDSIELIARIRHHSKSYINQVQRDEAYRALHESQRKLLEINIELERLTNVDGLTGLSNRRYYNEHLATQWKLAIREQNPLSVLMIDVDDFKRYNDTYGHLKGDEVLKGIAEAMQKSFRRPTDLAARFGGEEFVAVLPGTPLAALQTLGETLLRNVADLKIPHRAATVGGQVTVSVGGASVVPQREDSFLQLIETADQALYEAKRAGKNRVVTREHRNAGDSQA
jgi:two-component system chemotaxis family response regulator WspR